MDLNDECPFCGAKDVVLIELDREAWSIECRNCHATGPIKQTAELANFSWKNGVRREQNAGSEKLLLNNVGEVYRYGK